MHNEQLHSNAPSSGVANVMPEALTQGRFMAYLRLGWCPIPLKARDKAPVGSWKSYQTEFPKSPQCAAWEATENNVGIVTGRLSEIFVLDVDGEKGETTLRALEEKYGALPATPTVHTGKGRHFYFHYPEGVEIRNLSGHSSSGEVMEGIDARAEGGYAAAPPSIHPNGKQYVWHISPWDVELADAPQWLLDRMVVLPHAAPMLDYNNADDNHHDAYLQAALQGELAALVQAPSGSRNDQLNRSAFALGQLIAGGLNEQEARAKLEAIAFAIGLDRDEVIHTINSGIFSGMANPRTDKTDNREVVSVLSVGDVGISDKNAWPDPQPVKQELLPVPPLDPAIIPEPLRPWLVDIADRMQCPIDYVAASCMVVLGSLIGARCCIRPKRHDPNWFIVPNVWGAIIGRPSTLKSPSLAETMQPIRKLEMDSRDNHAKAMAEYELKQVSVEAKQENIKKQIADLAKGKIVEGKTEEDLHKEYAAIEIPEKPVWRRYHTNDATIEKLSELLSVNPQGMLVFRDELIGLLKTWEKEGHSSDRAFFMEAWNGFGGNVTDRIGRGTIITDNVCLSILGSTQPSRLSNYLHQGMKEIGNDGLIQRFQLLVFPDENKHWQLVDRGGNMFAKDRVDAIFATINAMDFLTHGGIKQGDKKPPYYRFDDDAQSLFYEWLIRLETEKLPNEEGLMLEHLAKYRKLMPALALIFHVVRMADGTGSGAVSVEAAQQAIDWCNYLEQHARRVYHMVSDMTQQSAAALAKRLSKGELEDNFTVRSLYRKGWNMLGDQELAEAACDELTRLGWIREHQQPPTIKGGRSKTTYVINPAVNGVAI
jgi:hypothetical protein